MLKYGYVNLKRLILPLVLGAMTVTPLTLWGVSSIYAATPPPEGAVKTRNASSDGGYKYIVTQDFGTLADTGRSPKRSVLRIFENGKELGPAHSLHADIGNIGLGRFSHWGGSDGKRHVSNLYISASDNTNPRTNGRMYTYRIDTKSTAAPAPVPSPVPVPTPVPAPAPVVIPAPVPAPEPDPAVPAPEPVQSTPPVPVPTPAPAPTPIVTPPSVPVPTPNPTVVIDRAFYVSPNGSDSNPGTLSAPWRTIRLAALKLSAGYTAILLDGVYQEGQIQFANSGTAGNPITIKAQNKWKAIVSSMAGCNPAFSIDKNYITIEDVRISSAPGNPTCASPSSADAAIRAWDSSDGFVGRGLLVDAGRSVGIKTNQDFSVVENSVVHNSIEVFNNQGTIFRNNVTYGADAWGGMITAKGGARNFQAYNNVIHMTTQQNAGGLVLGGSSSCCMFDAAAFECYNCVAYNNVVINETGRTGVGLYGFRTCKDCTIFNNVGIKGQLFVRPGGPSSSGTTVNSAFKNNIITCDSGGEATGGYNGWQSFQNLTVDYNNFHQCSSGVPAQSRAITGDPRFVNPISDWNLTAGSPALGSGVIVNVTGFNGLSIDASRNWTGTIRTAPVNLGIH